MNDPFLVGNTLYLRPINEADLNATYREWFNDPDVCKFNSHHRFPNYDANMREYYEEVIKSHVNLVLAIVTKDSDLHIGNVSLQSIDLLNQSAEFAIVIGNKEYWGKKVGQEAMHLVVEHGFNALNLNRIFLGTAEDNIGMQKLALALGCKEEGRSRQAIFKGGKFKDIFHYGLLRGEWTNKHT